MIVSASYRTDIPAFHSDWFAQRYRDGEVLVANPYGGKPYRVALTGPSVDGFVFWTRNIQPFLPVLSTVSEPFIVQFTITNYPRLLDERTPNTETAIHQVRKLADRYGTRSLVWRYDPILISDQTPTDWHRRNFATLTKKLCGAVDEVVCSFAQLYRKTERNLSKRLGDGRWRDPSTNEKHVVLTEFQEIAADHDMTLTLCTQPDLTPFQPARCIDAQRLSDVAGRAISARTKGNRPGCLCAQSRDIGAYDTCGHGCGYCYAVSDHTAVQRRLKERDRAPV
ncbi:MAG: DUF1848 domain-containing protein [Pseudomonadota bacterium]